MIDKPISPLRQRMIEDMTARHFAEKVQTDYIRYVRNFVAFLGRFANFGLHRTLSDARETHSQSGYNLSRAIVKVTSDTPTFFVLRAQ